MAVKPAVDGVRDAGWILDDDAPNLTRLPVRFYKDKLDPRVELTFSQGLGDGSFRPTAESALLAKRLEILICAHHWDAAQSLIEQARAEIATPPDDRRETMLRALPGLDPRTLDQVEAAGIHRVGQAIDAWAASGLTPRIALTLEGMANRLTAYLLE